MRSVHPLIFGNSLIYKQHNHVNPTIVFTHFVLPPLAEEILWNEIADFSLIRFKGNRLITIQMKDPEKVIANESSWIKRKTMEYNLKTINALYSFPAYMMDGRAEEALTLCKLNLAKHK